MLISQSLPRIYSPFLSCPLKLSSFSLPTHKSRPSFPRIKALDLDQNTVISLYPPRLWVFLWIGIPFFYESQIDSLQSEITLSHASLAMAPALVCGITLVLEILPPREVQILPGNGSVTVELGGDEREVSRCINCDGAGSLTCTTCQGSGIQPRYLDRRYEIFKNSKMMTEFLKTL
ncbi:hypothetical protein C3L33_11140, partial [Rhododendron williamsianum]